MPRIGVNLWKLPTIYFWYREYQDGAIEYEFDPDTGEPCMWGKTPDGLASIGWLPMNYDLSQKIAKYGEIGIPPTSSNAVFLDVAGVDKDEIVIFRDCTVVRGLQILCPSCRQVFYSGDHLTTCPICSHVLSGENYSPAEWDTVEYVLGIKNVVYMKISTDSNIHVSRKPFV